MEARACELCGGVAALYCAADSAFLCFKCDSVVHGANFLVARHVRRSVCSSCKSHTESPVAGVKPPPLLPICQSCSHKSAKVVHLDSISSTTSSSSCISGPKSTFNRRETVKLNCSRRAEPALANWCRKLGLVPAAVMPAAMEAVGVSTSELTCLPFRVHLMASLWFSLRLEGNGSGWELRVLRRLEAVSGVPCKVILAAESKLARLLSRRRITAGDLPEEGWGEC